MDLPVGIQLYNAPIDRVGASAISTETCGDQRVNRTCEESRLCTIRAKQRSSSVQLCRKMFWSSRGLAAEIFSQTRFCRCSSEGETGVTCRARANRPYFKIT